MKEGDAAKDFKLQDKDGQTYSLKDFKDDFLVLFFYPKDNTPGCTIESKEFSDAVSEFKKKKIKAIGISGGDNKTKEKFCTAHSLDVLLLSDPDFATSKVYDSWGEKSFLGKKFKGIFRKTFILNQKHSVIKIFDKVSPKGHTAEVLEFIESVSR